VLCSVAAAGQTLASFVRGVGPALGGVLWAASLELHVPGHQFVVFAVIAAQSLATWLLYGFVHIEAMDV